MLRASRVKTFAIWGVETFVMGESGAAGGRAFGIAALAWAEKAGAGRSTLSAAMEKRTHDSERRTPADRSRLNADL